jgi:subtilisin family serine protease
MRVNWSRAELTGLALAAYVPGEVLVTLSGELKDAEPIVEKLEKEFQLKRLKDVQLSSISKVLVLFRSKPKNLLPELILKLQRHLQVESVQPNFIYRGSNAQTGDSESSQYGPRLIRADRAARYSTGKGIRIALIDTGVDEHEDLKDRVIERANFTDDKDYRQDIHGTIIAGIISANPHNGFGINGIAPDASIISIKVLKQASASDSTATTSNSFAAVQGLLFAIRKKANVANLSFGAPRRDSIMADTVMAAVRGGMVVVAAAGNSGPQGRPDYPAALDGVIAVSAVGRDKMPYASGTVGDYIDLTAPGIGIHSTWPGNAFRDSKGSSEAAAHVTGVVALLLEKKPNASPIEIKNLLERTSTDLGPKGKDNVFGSGLVNACKALEELINSGGICSN